MGVQSWGRLRSRAELLCEDGSAQSRGALDEPARLPELFPYLCLSFQQMRSVRFSSPASLPSS